MHTFVASIKRIDRFTRVPTSIESRVVRRGNEGRADVAASSDVGDSEIGVDRVNLFYRWPPTLRCEMVTLMMVMRAIAEGWARGAWLSVRLETSRKTRWRYIDHSSSGHSDHLDPGRVTAAAAAAVRLKERQRERAPQPQIS